MVRAGGEGRGGEGGGKVLTGREIRYVGKMTTNGRAQHAIRPTAFGVERGGGGLAVADGRSVVQGRRLSATHPR